MLAHISTIYSLPAFGSEAPHSIGPYQVLVESNFLNVLILALALVYLGNKFLPKIIDQRKNQISKELENAKHARLEANKELEVVKNKCQNVEHEVEEIKKEARNTAETMKKQIEQESEKELENLKIKIKKEIISNQEEAIQSIKKSAGEDAIKLAEDTLVGLLKNEEVQKKLTGDFLSELKTISKN